MPLVNMNGLFQNGIPADCAVGAFNIHNLEFINAVISAAEAERSPVILALGMMSINFIGMEALAAAAIEGAKRAAVPVAVHLDHARDIATVEKALKNGLSSVMFDGSALSFDENLKQTIEVVKMAHSFGATAEGEVGALGNVCDASKEVCPTDPKEAIYFADETQVDFLAISIGSVHGMKTQGARLDLTLLKDLATKLACPLVLHGASGVVDEDIREAITSGIRKINVNPGLKVVFMKQYAAALAADPSIDLLGALKQGMQGISQSVQKRLRLFGSNGRV